MICAGTWHVLALAILLQAAKAHNIGRARRTCPPWPPQPWKNTYLLWRYVKQTSILATSCGNGTAEWGSPALWERSTQSTVYTCSPVMDILPQTFDNKIDRGRHDSGCDLLNAGHVNVEVLDQAMQVRAAKLMVSFFLLPGLVRNMHLLHENGRVGTPTIDTSCSTLGHASSTCMCSWHSWQSSALNPCFVVAWVRGRPRRTLSNATTVTIFPRQAQNLPISFPHWPMP